MIPLAGPVPPGPGTPAFEAVGRSGHIAIFEADDIEDVRQKLEQLLSGWMPGAADTFRDRIEDVLGEIDLAQESYADWTAENDSETHTELYG